METEVYSPDFDQWTVVAQLSMGQSEAGACLVNDRIFIVGGYCWSARRCIKVIQVIYNHYILKVPEKGHIRKLIKTIIFLDLRF